MHIMLWIRKLNLEINSIIIMIMIEYIIWLKPIIYKGHLFLFQIIPKFEHRNNQLRTNLSVQCNNDDVQYYQTYFNEFLFGLL